MIDRTAKALLLAIAIGIWVLILTLWFHPPVLHDEEVLQELQDVHQDIEDLNDRVEELIEPPDAPDVQPKPTGLGPGGWPRTTLPASVPGRLRP